MARFLSPDKKSRQATPGRLFLTLTLSLWRGVDPNFPSEGVQQRGGPTLSARPSDTPPQVRAQSSPLHLLCCVRHTRSVCAISWSAPTLVVARVGAPELDLLASRSKRSTLAPLLAKLLGGGGRATHMG